MRVIITDGWPATHRPLYITPKALFLFFLFLMVAGVVLTLGVYRLVADDTWTKSQAGLVVQTDMSLETQTDFERLNIEMLAKKVGEMQGQVIQLDALARRISEVSGVDIADDLNQGNGQGGLLEHARPLSVQELVGYLTDLEDSVQQTSDLFILSQAHVSEQRLSKLMIPNQVPVLGVRLGSGFGWRIDPLTGKKAVHKGLDFPGKRGTKVLAAAGGVVITVIKSKTGFGNYVEIDHGGNLTTRYAHLQRSHVQIGDLVKKGQHIADLGSSGRSTGPHLHFEVLLDGDWVDPKRFLRGRDKKKLVRAH